MIMLLQKKIGKNNSGNGRESTSSHTENEIGKLKEIIEKESNDVIYRKKKHDTER